MFFFKKSVIHIPRNVYDEMTAHAKEDYPNECCGVITGINTKVRKVFASYRVKNLNTERTEDRYAVDPREINLIDKEARVEGIEIIGFYHSHPDHPDRPSEFDREMGQAGYSYVIISVNKGGGISARAWTIQGENGPFSEETIKVV